LAVLDGGFASEGNEHGRRLQPSDRANVCIGSL
jgi:hypothetical protein